MPAIQEQKEVTSLNHSIKGRSLLLHLKKKDQIKDSSRQAQYFGTKTGEKVRRSPMEILNPEEPDTALTLALQLIYWIAEKGSNLDMLIKRMVKGKKTKLIWKLKLIEDP